MCDEHLVDVLRLDSLGRQIAHELAALEYPDLHWPDTGINQHPLVAGSHDEAAVLEHDVTVMVEPALVLLPLLICRAPEILRPLDRHPSIRNADDFEIADHE